MSAKRMFVDAWLDLLPTSRGIVEDFYADWPVDTPFTVLMGELAEHIALVMTQEPAVDLAPVFRHVELAVAGRDQQVKDMVATGLLEALVAEVDIGQIPADRLELLLGPESRSFVDAWDRFTGAETFSSE